jgi:NAD(P)-dependent dehydrogenase (short-subunit alcohol dehydrogenase family)
MAESNVAQNVQDLKSENLFDVKGFVAVVTGVLFTSTKLTLGCNGYRIDDNASVCTRPCTTKNRLVTNGAKVYILGRRKEVLDAAVKHHGQNNQIVPVECDVTSKSSIENAVSTVSSKEGHIHLLVNNSGIAGPTSKSEASKAEDIKKDFFSSSDFPEWDEVYRTNISAQYFTSFAFLPLLKKATEAEKGFSASVINITSISGITKDNQNHFAYNSSKAGAIHLTHLLARELVSFREVFI